MKLLAPRYRRNTTVKTELINFRIPEDLAAALRRAAADNIRSVNAQGVFYLRQGLTAEGRYQSEAPTTGHASPGRTGLSKAAQGGERATDRQRVSIAPPMLPPGSQEAPSAARVEAIIAALEVEIRHEQNRPLGSNAAMLRKLLPTTFPDVSGLQSVRAKGLAAWIDAGAGPGLIGVLFPNDPEAVTWAKKQKNAVQMDRRIAEGPELKRFIADKGIKGRGAVNLRNVLEQFDGMTIAEAVQQGPLAWLDAGIGEDCARKIFDETTAREAKRRATSRGNVQKKVNAVRATPAHAS
jgi:hypothetical protein